MSKGNMLLGYARGSVGDLVFQRQRGQQVIKSRNRNPYNPKTDEQIRQRAQFSNSVKFFTRGVQNLFKFAFEGKGPNESDFNAFMRYNQNRGVLISKPALQEISYPALGNYMMSKGSLRTPDIEYDPSHKGIVFKAGLIEELTTIGELSTIIKNKYSLMNGDIITILKITANGSTSKNTPQVFPITRGYIEWKILQFTIDPESKDSVSDFFIDTQITTEGGLIIFENDANDSLQGATVIFSRNTKKGLRCSTSYLVNNDSANISIQETTKKEYVDRLLETWKVEPKSILQGGVVDVDPTKSKFKYQIFADANCTIVPTPGYRTNKLWLRVNRDMTYGNIKIVTGNPDYEWQNMTIDAMFTSDEPQIITYYAYGEHFVSSGRQGPIAAGTVIPLVLPGATGITLGNNLITEFS